MAMHVFSRNCSLQTSMHRRLTYTLQRDKRESRVCMHAVFVHRIVGFECGFFSSMTFQGNYTCKIT